MSNARLILNKYLPLKEIGSGGFGTVFVCKDMLMQRLVAIKKIELTELDAQRAQWVREDMNRDAQVDALTAFETGRTTINLLEPGEQDSLADSLEQRYLANVPGLDEARMAAALSDPTIVTMYDCQIAGNTVYLVMEYVEGVTLTQVLEQRNDDITLDVVSTVFESVSRALEVAHAHGVLHFDIKPDNVLIDAAGNVKVTDFGLATLCDAQGEGVAAAGTIGYMPLEQMRREPLDARADQWALASVVYEMLVGENPFLAPTLDKALTCIDGAELTLPSRCWDDLPEQADDVIFRALDPQKEERYESVSAFADDLMPLLGDADLGRKELAAFLRGEDADNDLDNDAATEGAAPTFDPEARSSVLGLFHRLQEGVSDFQKTLVIRCFAALGSGFLTAIGAWNISQISGVQNPLFWAFVLGAAALGAVVPSGGALAGLVVLSAALLANGVYVPGILLLAAACAWWWFVGREGCAAANGLVSFPLLSCVGLAPASALITGQCTRMVPALATTALGWLLCVILASFGSMDLTNWGVFQQGGFAFDSAVATSAAATGVDADAALVAAGTNTAQETVAAAINGNMVALVTDAGTWIILASWLLAALAACILARPRKRVLAVLGAILGFLLVMMGIWFACAFDPYATSMIPATSLLLSALGSGAVALFVAAALPLPDI